jgi:hypothetical protein
MNVTPVDSPEQKAARLIERLHETQRRSSRRHIEIHFASNAEAVAAEATMKAKGYWTLVPHPHHDDTKLEVACDPIEANDMVRLAFASGGRCKAWETRSWGASAMSPTDVGGRWKPRSGIARRSKV